MTNKEALARFKGDLEMMKSISSHITNQMEMYEWAIKALEAYQINEDLCPCGLETEIKKDYSDVITEHIKQTDEQIKKYFPNSMQNFGVPVDNDDVTPV